MVCVFRVIVAFLSSTVVDRGGITESRRRHVEGREPVAGCGIDIDAKSQATCGAVRMAVACRTQGGGPHL